MPGHVLERRLRLLLLEVAVEVRHPSPGLGTAVQREHALVRRLQAHPLHPPVERVDVHRQRVRLAGHHRAEQPAERGALGDVRHVDDLLGAPLDLRVAARPLEVEARLRDRRPQPHRRPPRALALDRRVELPRNLHGPRPPAVGARRVEPPPQQLGHLLAVQQPVREPERGQLGADRVGVGERLAHHPAVRAKVALQWTARQRAARAQLAEALAHRAQRRQVRRDDEHARADRRLVVGVTAQRVLERRIQPPARERQAIAVGHRAERRIAGEMAHLLAHPLRAARRGRPGRSPHRTEASARGGALTADRRNPCASWARSASAMISGLRGVTSSTRTSAPSLVIARPV